MANLLLTPSAWKNTNTSVSPPEYWNGTTFFLYGSFGIGYMFDMGVVGTPAPSSTAAGTVLINHDGPGTLYVQLVSSAYVRKQMIACTPGNAQAFNWDVAAGDHIIVTDNNEATSPTTIYGLAVMITPGAQPAAVNYNCECDDASGNRTLLELRNEMLVRLGFAAQVNNPPPGMAALCNSFLQGAQRTLYRRYAALRTERIYQWDMVEGVRYYDLDGNADVCTKRLDPKKVTWVGTERDGVWSPMVCGIPPERYSFETSNFPTRYEIRQCLEIWPAPTAEAGKVRIKGHFELEPFTADAHHTTIDDELVFLLALANAKAHYGQPDGSGLLAQMEGMLSNIVAGSHHTRRYVPGVTQLVQDPDPVWTATSWPGP